MKLKMYCIFAKESIQKMNGIRGKMCSQAGHAYLHTFQESLRHFPELAREYLASDHAYKITLVVDSVDDLKKLQEAYKNICATRLITDAGFTVFKEPTTTCLGLGPIREEDIGEDLKALKLFY